jgi:hypothetical protein
MTGDFTFAESNRLREVPGRKGVADKRLQDHVTGSLLPFRRGRRFCHLAVATKGVIGRP